MRLGWIEKILFKNPLRPAIQNAFEARQMLRMGGACPNAKALEIGCGSGSGIKLLFNLEETEDGNSESENIQLLYHQYQPTGRIADQ